MAEVVPVEGNDALGAAHRGAYVSVVGLAPDHEHFAAGIAEFCDRMGFQLCSLDSIESLDVRARTHGMDPRIVEELDQLSAERPYAFGTFDTFPLE